MRPHSEPSAGSYAFNGSWLFGGVYAEGAEKPGYDDAGFVAVTLPHTVVPLSWGDWQPASWEKLWVYRKHFRMPPMTGHRVFADFDGVMANADLVLNGVKVASHQGGYLPFSAELTGHLIAGDNVLAVIVDSRQTPVPPMASADGAAAIDYLQPGGIYRDVALRITPAVFLSDVFAKPVKVLANDRSIEVQATIEALTVPAGPVHVTAELLDGSRALAAARTTAHIATTGPTNVHLTITGIGPVTLWSPDSPKLYTVRTTAAVPPRKTHTAEVRIGFRHAVFRQDGFFLNGQRLKIFGLNRHQIFPYLGMAVADRLQRRDAELLKYELNCNMVRCSHYPQSPHFLDACDELGLMVWQEPPGWQYVGDPAWQEIVVQNVRDMVIRDRNRPSVIVWATRLNETANWPELYARTRRVARDLDGTRQTTGAMTAHSAEGWAEDVFAYDDYGPGETEPALRPPLPDVPYLVSEAVGAISGAPTYRWTDPGAVLALQPLMHATVHATARSGQRYAGLLAWAAMDYASMNGGDRIWRSLKTPGVLDTFRAPKPGAAFYRSQIDPEIRPVIVPAFFWDFGTDAPSGPGEHAMVATNCDRLEFYVGGEHVASRAPDTGSLGGLAYPPVFVNLTVDGSGQPELRIDGYVRKALAASVLMSADTSRDRLGLTVDHSAIRGDGTDTTRITFRALDAYGNQRRYVTGEVGLSISGPATLIGDGPFSFTAYGAVGGAFVRSQPGRSGLVTVAASHSTLGEATVQIGVVARPGPPHCAQPNYAR
jgi:beta-galactosidase